MLPPHFKCSGGKLDRNNCTSRLLVWRILESMSEKLKIKSKKQKIETFQLIDMACCVMDEVGWSIMF